MERTGSDHLCLSGLFHPSQVLTLANGDRILMTPAMRAMFEPENLINASPATVSRAGRCCGMCGGGRLAPWVLRCLPAAAWHCKAPTLGCRLSVISHSMCLKRAEIDATPYLSHPAGIIYVSASELGWEPVAKSWLARRTDAAQVRMLRPGDAGARWGCIPLLGSRAVCGTSPASS